MKTERTVPGQQSIRAQTRRILASVEFANAERMGSFLEFVVREALAGRGARLKEYVIGVSVFGRPETFDPTSDPIVRVEARRLRSKLARYYEGGGLHDEVVIDLPKGGYVPAFRVRERTEAAGGDAQKRILVLPFQTLSSSEDGRLFGEGLTWELTHRLTQIDHLSVIGWNSAFPAAEAQARALEAAARIQAGLILMGSVRQAENRLRVVAQLVDASNGVYLWSRTFDRQFAAIFAIQEEIAEAIADHLQPRPGGPAKAAARARTSYNLEAYRHYLEGRAQWNLRTEKGVRQGLESFRRSTEIDPGFALGYAGLADAYALLADFGWQQPDEVMPAAKSAARQALEIDGELGEAYCSLAFITALYEWKWSEAEAHFRTALDLNPSYATAHFWLATDLLTRVGRLPEAVAEIEIARRLDPLSDAMRDGEAFIAMLERRYTDAERMYRTHLESSPDFARLYSSLGRLYSLMGRYEEALQLFDENRARGGTAPTLLGARGQTLAWMGREAEARQALTELKELSDRVMVPSTAVALVHLGLGERDTALDWLERGVERREFPVTAMLLHPAYDELRGEPRFFQLLGRMGLV